MINRSDFVKELQRYLKNDFGVAPAFEWCEIARAYIALNNDSKLDDLHTKYVVALRIGNRAGIVSAKNALINYMEEW